MSKLIPTTLRRRRGWLPTDITGCQLWLDAADRGSMLPASGDTITTWNDKSGQTGRNVSQSDPSKRPTYNNNRLALSGGQWMAGTNNFTASNSGTMFSVARHNGTRGRVIDIRIGQMSIGQEHGSTPHMFFHNSTSLGVIARTDGTTQASIITNTRDGAPNPFYGQNGSTLLQYGSGGTAFTHTTTFNVGSDSGTAQFLNGEVMEILYYNTALSTAERQRVEGYLAHKWGLVAELPDTHPYKFIDARFRTPWMPTEVAGSQLWLDAMDDSANLLTTNASDVITAISDKSSFRRSITGTNGFSYRRTGVPAFTRDTDSANVRLGQVSMTLNQPCTIYAVAQTSSSGYIVDGLTDSTRIAFLSAVNSTPIMFAGTEVIASTFQFNTRAVYTAQYNTTTSILFRNSASIASGNVGSQNATGLTIGARFNGADQWRGDINELLVYTGIPTTADRQRVEGYLAWKWGLQSNLPSFHPHRWVSIYNERTLWQPTGSQLWLDANDRSSMLPATGTSITQWNDKSGNGRHATGVNNPTFTNDKITFNSASSQYFTLGDVLDMRLNPIHIFTVARFGSSSGTMNVIGKSSARPLGGRWSILRDGGHLIPLLDIDTTGSNASRVNNTGVADTNTTSRVLSMHWDRTRLSMNTNGTEVLTRTSGMSDTTTDFNTSDPLYIGAYGNSSGTAPLSGFFFGGDIHEVLVFNTALTDLERRRVEGYLAGKWGLTLPNTHPFAKQPPFGNTQVVCFEASGSSQLWTVPAGVSSIRVIGWGAGAGGTSSFVGQAGTYVEGDFAVEPGEELSVLVFAGGGAGSGTGFATRVIRTAVSVSVAIAGGNTSGFLDNLTSTRVLTTTTGHAPNQGSPYWFSNIGVGGATNGAGNPGRLIIEYSG